MLFEFLQFLSAPLEAECCRQIRSIHWIDWRWGDGDVRFVVVAMMFAMFEGSFVGFGDVGLNEESKIVQMKLNEILRKLQLTALESIIEVLLDLSGSTFLYFDCTDPVNALFDRFGFLLVSFFDFFIITEDVLGCDIISTDLETSGVSDGAASKSSKTSILFLFTSSRFAIDGGSFEIFKSSSARIFLFKALWMYNLQVIDMRQKSGLIPNSFSPKIIIFPHLIMIKIAEQILRKRFCLEIVTL